MKYLQFNVTPMDAPTNFQARIWWLTEAGTVAMRDVVTPTEQAGWKWIESELASLSASE